MTLLPFTRTPVDLALTPTTTERRTARITTRGERPPLIPSKAVLVVAVLAAAAATGWSAATHSMVLYGDARAHMDVARHVTDALTPGWAQLGSVWLPLPQILLVPLVAITPLWHNGAAGAIVSGICFVYAAVRVYSIVQDLTASKVGAWAGFLVFVVNLNLLYMQSTALTEPVLLAFSVGAVFHLTRWMRTFSVRELLWGGLFVFCATLTRYEGWSLLVASLVVVWGWGRLADRRRKSPQAGFVMFAVIAGYGIVLWLLYNLIIFHDALYFLHSAYSAQAINGAQAQFGLLGTKGNVKETILTYGWDVLDVVGIPVVIVAGLSMVASLVTRYPEKRRTIATFILLGAPVLFEFLSLYAGQTTIRVPQVAPYAMWNDRYGIMALPLCAVAAGLLVGRWKWTIPVVAVATVVATVTMVVVTPLTLADGRTGTSAATTLSPPGEAAYLAAHYRGGRILADDSVASALMFQSGLDLTQFVTVGFHPYWGEALGNPPAHVAWVVAFPNDAVSGDIRFHPDRFRDFTLVYEKNKIKIYQRIKG